RGHGHPLRPLVERRRPDAGDGSRLPHRPEAAGVRLQPHRGLERRGADARLAAPEALSRGHPAGDPRIGTALVGGRRRSLRAPRRRVTSGLRRRRPPPSLSDSTRPRRASPRMAAPSPRPPRASTIPPAGTRVDRLRLLGVQGSSKVMAGELSRLAGRALEGDALARFRAATPAKLGAGGLAYPFDAELATIALLYHRTSARVLWDLYESDATRLEPLYENLVEAVAADDRPWLWDGARISVLAFAPRSVAAGERQVVGTVKNAIVDGAARRGWTLTVSPDRPDLTIHARSHVDPKGTPQLTISVDLAGRPKHERGYRTRAGQAPLREDVAAYLVMLTRHDARREALIDPCAGSGTLAVEAASMARARVAWYSGRRVAAERLPALASHFQAPRRPLFGDTRPLVYANELDPEVCRLLERSVETAGVGPDVRISCGDFREIDPRE